MRLRIRARDALRFKVSQARGLLVVTVSMDVEVVQAKPAIDCASESDLWARLVAVAYDPKSEVMRGLQICSPRDRYFTIGLLTKSGCAVKSVGREEFADEAALRSWLAEFAADQHASIAWEAGRVPVRASW